MGLPPKLLKKGITDMVRISDARMSGTAYGTVVLHAAPEAALGGPLAVVQDGDMITLDAANRRLTLEISDDELAARQRAWQPPPPAMQSGYQKLYVDHVLQADRGCDLDFLLGKRGADVPRHSPLRPACRWSRPTPSIRASRTASSSSPAAAPASARASSSISARKARGSPSSTCRGAVGGAGRAHRRARPSARRASSPAISGTSTDCRRRSSDARSEDGPIKVLVNNAGNDDRHRTEDVTSDLLGRPHGGQPAAPVLRRPGGAAADARCRRRLDHQFRLDHLDGRRCRLHRLCHGQVGDQRPDARRSPASSAPSASGSTAWCRAGS